ncbi:MAG: hypothetical protein LBR68_04955 [Lachnoclostridium sp.]|jgi:glycogen operon protein|nr:hypothetical protein [Lachnoclostridium sp.]
MDLLSYTFKKGCPLPLGVSWIQSSNTIQVAVDVGKAKKCRLKISAKGKKAIYIPMYSMEEYGVPNIFSVLISGDNIAEFFHGREYIIEADKKEIADPYAKWTSGREKFGKSTENHKIGHRFHFESFDWSGEKRRNFSWQDSILYQCHVRGFTKHKSSEVSHSGTFLGVTEKIKHLKKLGINTLLFLPLYDFNEIIDSGSKKVNYWGYTKDSYYFAPKASYGTTEHSPVYECKQMIKTLHQNGFQVLLDMHFEEKTPDFILECLRYYMIDFHIDGFLINQNVVPSELLIRDPIIGNAKLLGTSWEHVGTAYRNQHLASFNDEFMTNARCFLKGDERQVFGFYQHFKEKGEDTPAIHYITQINGFTMQDLVSFDIKHNEDNGERNEDGTEYNYSWNCGQEGSTQRKKVREIRKKQVKNAMSMLLLSLAAPMILAGDEFGNSQKGNNNAYCQDNPISWLNWSLLDKNSDIFEFTRKLISFRKEHPIYQMKKYQGMDYKGYGVPDISCHGIEPWRSSFVNYSRELGILFYGSYLPTEKDMDSLYIVFNMHWEKQTFFLPQISKTSSKKEWTVLFSTSEVKSMGKHGKYVLDSRSIAVFSLLDDS